MSEVWLSKSLSLLPGVGPKRLELLHTLGFETIGDLLKFFPYRYLDASQFTKISNLRLNEFCTIQASVVRHHTLRTPTKRTWLTTVTVQDETGQLGLTFFHQPYLAKQLVEGEVFAFTGKVSAYKNKLSLTNPIMEKLGDELIHTGRVVPLYSQAGGLSSKWVRKTIHSMLPIVAEDLQAQEYLEKETLTSENLMPYDQARQKIHFPDNNDQIKPAKQRIAFDEIWEVFTLLEQQDQERKKLSAVLQVDKDKAKGFFTDFHRAVPFPLTESQQTACQNIYNALTQKYPSYQLIQGEVGSGKTFVAAFALCLIASQGGQALYLAPTSILAQQHFHTVSQVAKKLGLKCSLWTAGEKTDSSAQIFIGTQALLRSPEIFAPALLVVDEEHRFGVKQRQFQWQNDIHPHRITMTATPIPRTLALTMYDSDRVSFLEQIPGKEKKIRTRLLSPKKLKDQWQWLNDQVKQGTQAFIIAPFIEKSETPGWEEIAAAQEIYPEVKKALSHAKVALLTGRTPAEEKAKILQKMQDKKIDVLVATPVIEVGIDIPNASVITILSAERFGLAQLHQLRGRVGRAGQEAWCFLVPTPGTPETDRLVSLETNNDGASLAEVDLKTRGAGQFFGNMQSGWEGFQLASWLDLDIIEKVKRIKEKV